MLHSNFLFSVVVCVLHYQFKQNIALNGAGVTSKLISPKCVLLTHQLASLCLPLILDGDSFVACDGGGLL